MIQNRSLSLLLLLLALPAAAREATSPALNALREGAAQPECSMQGVTGEGCPQEASAVQAVSTGTLKPEAARPAIAHRGEAAVPSPSPIKKTLGSMVDGVTEFFAPDGVKGGIAFGAAIGMLLLAATPVGILGGALIGAAVGAVLVGGLIGKLWGAVHKS